MLSTDIKSLIDKINKPNYIGSLPSTLDDFLPRYKLNKFKEYLSPDSDYYFSSLNPTFSLELELSPMRIKYLSVLSLRDGVMPLLKFYVSNPRPKDESLIHIIDEDFSSLVPEAWRSQTLLRRFKSQKTDVESTHNNFIIFISPNYFSSPLEIVYSEIQKVNKELLPETEVYLFFSSMKLRGVGQAQKDDLWGYKIMELFAKHLETKNFRVINWNEYSALNLNSFLFFFINPLKFFLSDSFLLHDACQKGASPLVKDKKNDINPFSEHYHPLSINHGFILHQSYSSYNKFHSEKLENVITEFDQSESNKKRLFRANQFCSHEFESWAHDVAKSLYLENNSDNSG